MATWWDEYLHGGQCVPYNLVTGSRTFAAFTYQHADMYTSLQTPILCLPAQSALVSKLPHGKSSCQTLSDRLLKEMFFISLSCSVQDGDDVPEGVLIQLQVDQGTAVILDLQQPRGGGGSSAGCSRS
jgi:hypothetical protein